MGIELGKLLYINRSSTAERVVADRGRLRLLSILLGAFLTGGVLGAAGFHAIGYIATVPLALMLIALTAVPVYDDVRSHRRT